MPISNTITTAVAPQELTESQKAANQLVNDSDLALKRLVSAVDSGFQLLWGNKESPKELADVQAILNELTDAEEASVFDRHAKLVAFLATNGWVTFEDWELTPAYAISLDEGGRVQLSGDLVEAWTA